MTLFPWLPSPAWILSVFYSNILFSFQDSSADFASLYADLQKEHNKTLLTSRTMEEKTKKLESDLRDARDNAELLEFRLLELEQRESRERSPDLARKVEATIEMDVDSQSVKSFGLDSGCDSLTSVDDLLDIQKDFRVSWLNWAEARVPAHIYYDLTGQLSQLAGCWAGKVGKSCYC